MIMDVLRDTYIDALRLLPFLFLAYLAMEWLERFAGERMQALVRGSGKAGPAIGGVLGIFPQCGFATAAANFYAGGLISLGTLLAVFLSTSDEMLPILLTEQAPPSLIGKLLLTKVVIAVAAGFLADLFLRRNWWRRENSGAPKPEGGRQPQIENLCERHGCHCERGILQSAVSHTWKIFLYLVLISLALNFAIAFTGEERLAALILDRLAVGLFAAGLVGMIPNCAASVILTQLYLEGVLGAGPLLAGLLSGSGVGILTLFWANGDKWDNARILAILYGVGLCAGAAVEAFGVRF